MYSEFNDVLVNPDYNLDYDLHVLNPENKDTQDFQRDDCVFDAIQRIDKFIKNQVRANQRLRQENQQLKTQVNMLRSQSYGRGY